MKVKGERVGWGGERWREAQQREGRVSERGWRARGGGKGLVDLGVCVFAAVSSVAQ